MEVGFIDAVKSSEEINRIKSETNKL